MEEETLFYMLALQSTVGVGPITAKRLLEYFGSPKEVFLAKEKDVIVVHRIGSMLWRNLQDSNVLKRAEQELKNIEKYHLSCFDYTDSCYPTLLKECEDSPLLLFSTVPSISLDNRKVISFIGTRNPSKRGVEICMELISDLKSYNPIIVSGLAYGVDITAHIAALDNGLDTYAVLGHGLNRIYPDVHTAVARRIEEQGGACLSEFWVSSKVDRENFIQRNRIVAGMSQATIVIESAIKGGSMSTVTFANDYNRDVFAVPGRVGDIMSAGCNHLIQKNKAQLLTSAKEIVETLNWDAQAKAPKVIQPQLFLDLNPDEQLIVNYLSKHDRELLDIIALSCSLPIYKVSSILLNLEMLGVVRPLPGKYFELV
ncbi:DNA-processing protein DprA [Myroides odoratimimus]